MSMRGAEAGENDQDPVPHDPDPNGSSVMASLSGLRLTGALLLRSEFTERWAYTSPPYQELVDALRPAGSRLVLFHIVASGECWVTASDRQEQHAIAGDVIVAPYAEPHRVRGSQPASPISLVDLLPSPPWARLPVIRHGDGGAQTDIVCGYLESDDPLFNPELAALPPVFVVRPGGGESRRWVEASIDYALTLTSQGDVPAPVSTRLTELLLVEMLRQHLTSAPAAGTGWLAALRDPVLARAMALLHGAPQHGWTVTELADEVAVSRSLLDQRFRAVLGRSPIRYLTDWRMHVASNLLTNTDLGVASVSRRVGYGSEEAFSRAFKRAFGVAPAVWRQR